MTNKTNIIHSKIQTVCNYLTTRYAGKKHGGYNIYEDDKIVASTDTYVPNVNLRVKVNDETEHVFGCSYDGSCTTYYTGLWEDYLDKLYLKATETRYQLEEHNQQQRNRKQAPSDMANSVFGGIN